jgi:DNA invertase Pin-like site-specific DNA recombinase
MLVGYARTSSLAQVAGLEAQERELRAAGCDKIFMEQVSSVAQREQLELALDYVREGDTFIVTKLDRLARSVGDLPEIVARLEKKKGSLRVLAMSGAEPLDTGTAIGRLMLAVIGAVGQAEREAMLERQREGIDKAKREGRYKGRVPTARRQTAQIIRLKESGVRPSEIASKLGIGRASTVPASGEPVKPIIATRRPIRILVRDVWSVPHIQSPVNEPLRLQSATSAIHKRGSLPARSPISPGS